MGCGGCFASDHDATAVLTCLTCRHARATRFVSCSLSGRPIVRKVCGNRVVSDAGRADKASSYAGCPINGVDDLGRIRWAGILWRGIAFPLRQIMADDVLAGWLLKLPRPAAIEDFPGCGCVDKLKGWAEKAGDSWHGSAAMRTAFLTVAMLIVLALFSLAGCASRTPFPERVPMPLSAEDWDANEVRSGQWRHADGVITNLDGSPSHPPRKTSLFMPPRMRFGTGVERMVAA